MTEYLYEEYKGVYLPTLIYPQESLKFYEDFTFRQDDILIVTYPKSGTTWMQEIVPLVQSGGDLSPVLTVPNWDRVPWLEESRARTLNLEQRESPRLFATHYQYDMMPASFFTVKPKVIYLMRNPKDVFISSYYYHGMASFLVNPGTQEEFLQKFINGEVIYGSWFDHVKGWLNAKDQDCIMYISYEEMILDLKDSVSRISQFLGKTLDNEVIEKIADHCVFKNMKQNKMSNFSMVPTGFMDQNKSGSLRKGIAGDWKNHFTVAQTEYFDAAYNDKMKDIKYPFVWD
ncbi:sulfotransferase family 2, cytosolic sulfotransferase 2 [Esox lucius]|uniref:Sulfotransferase n=1 Tax=Esox lucius TaxID=8010 RepID=C1BZC2_ESOLU|nr:sulfotransferase family 2, cytosolic sulfotransferase 2 [Esox lucius]ACO14375.1 Sulfotransferase family cytosolic 2B member 1 [Esox lucius]